MGKKAKRLSLGEFASLSTKNLAKLEEAGIDTIPILAHMHQLEIKELLDTTLNKARAILTEARNSLPDFEVESLRASAQKESKQEYLSSGVEDIDKLLGGKGFERGSIYELAAEYGAGKTQVAMSMAVRGAQEGGVVVIDTEGTWRAARLLQIGKSLGLDCDKILDNIRITRPLSSTDQSTVLRTLVEDEGVKAPEILKLEIPPVLLVVDSITGQFRSEYPGRAVLAERQNRLAEHLKHVYIYGKKNNATVILTNQVIHSPDIFNPGMRAVGGNVVGHACTYRIVLKKKKGTLRIMQVVDSAVLPISEAPFALTSAGIKSASEVDE